MVFLLLFVYKYLLNAVLASLYSSDCALVCKCFFFFWGTLGSFFSLCGNIRDLRLRTFFFPFLHAASYAVGLLETWYCMKIKQNLNKLWNVESKRFVAFVPVSMFSGNTSRGDWNLFTHSCSQMYTWIVFLMFWVISWRNVLPTVHRKIFTCYLVQMWVLCLNFRWGKATVSQPVVLWTCNIWTAAVTHGWLYPNSTTQQILQMGRYK